MSHRGHVVYADTMAGPCTSGFWSWVVLMLMAMAATVTGQVTERPEEKWRFISTRQEAIYERMYNPTLNREGVCQDPLGMESGAIPDSSITASSTWSSAHEPYRARLNGIAGIGAWATRTNNIGQWLQIDLGEMTRVTGVITQGRQRDIAQWVTSYKLQFSADGATWTTYASSDGSDEVFTGNTDMNTPVTNLLENPVATRYVRFYPQSWHQHILMRVEILGCVPWLDVFSTVKGTGQTVYDAWSAGPDAPVRHFRCPVVEHWESLNIERVKVVLESNSTGNVELIFDGTNTDKFTWFSKSRLLSSPWNDINTEPQNYFSIVGAPQYKRSFYINRNWGGCPNDAGWLAVFDAGPQGLCEFERAPEDQLPYIRFSKTSGYANLNGDDIATADRMVISIDTPGHHVLCSCPAGQSLSEDGTRCVPWLDVFSTVKGTGQTVYDAWSAGPDAPVRHFRCPVVEHWESLNIERVKVVLESNSTGNVELIFDGTNTDKFTWFSKSRLLSSPWNDTNTEPQNYFSIVGAPQYKRSFYINRNWGGCPNDAGWLAVFDAGPQGLCEFERAPEDQLPYIRFSKTSGYANLNGDDIATADRMVISIDTPGHHVLCSCPAGQSLSEDGTRCVGILSGLTLVDAGIGHLIVSWTVVGNLPISRYRLRYQSADGSGSDQDLSPAPEIAATSATVQGLFADTEYTLTLTSFGEDDQPNGEISGTYTTDPVVVNVQCDQDSMSLSIPRAALPAVNVEDLHLLDPDCGATEDEDEDVFKFETHLQECGTRQEVTFETAPVRHALGVDAGRRHDAERAPTVRVTIKCSFTAPCRGLVVLRPAALINIHQLLRPVSVRDPSGARSVARLDPCGVLQGADRLLQFGRAAVRSLAGSRRDPVGSRQLTSPSEVEIGDNLQVGLLALVAEEERQAEPAGACSAARRVPGSEVTASLRRISPNGARSDFNSELKSIRRPRGAKNRPAAVGKPAGHRPGPTSGDDKFIFSNEVIANQVTYDNGAVRNQPVNLHFQCEFLRQRDVSGGAIMYNIPSPRIQIVDANNSFTIEMHMFTSEDFLATYESSDFPLQVSPSDRLHFGLSVASPLDNLELFARDCVSTPTTSPDDSPRVSIIDDGCQVDETLQKADELSNDKALYYSVAAFTFPNALDPSLVYFHCTMIICFKDDPDSRCKQGCIPPARRRRAVSDGTEGRVRRESSRDKQADITQGPFQVQSGEAGIAGVPLGTAVGAAVGVAGIMVLLIVAVGLKKRGGLALGRKKRDDDTVGLDNYAYQSWGKMSKADIADTKA
ncbi:hypothetical protein Bbelb_118780 [Branchiostoma belcheri]|nr:hypothetical protein Bbelb_118780 [Branchiostoma belcheri]